MRATEAHGKRQEGNEGTELGAPSIREGDGDTGQDAPPIQEGAEVVGPRPPVQNKGTISCPIDGGKAPAGVTDGDKTLDNPSPACPERQGAAVDKPGESGTNQQGLDGTDGLSGGAGT